MYGLRDLDSTARSYCGGMSEDRAPAALPRALVVMMWVLAALFNVVFVNFFALYSAANDWAVERSEATGAFEPSQLLPHDAALWLSAHVAIVLLVVLDAAGVALWLRIRRGHVKRSQ
ncbi:hypothetical protein Csp2054_10985 [Curtobacterium sp. 'Ferrero']|nr:hypothetical protein Csp2054_10985 [Curtobacterium sp. 'Ferrero']